jgi:hypothetical protein
MKKMSLLTAALISLGLVSQASADNTIYLTGSTAFRSTVFTALTTAGTIFDAAPDFQAEDGGSAINKVNYMLFHGNIGGVATYIDCSWNGSDAGMACIAGVTIDNDGAPLFGSPAFFLKTDGTVPAGYNAATPAPGGLLESASRQGDLAFADTSSASAIAALAPSIAASPLISYGQIAAVTFTWAKNAQATGASGAAFTAWTHLSNLSTFQAQALFAAGSLPADFFTGVAADNGTSVYLVGRNKGSGTRANTLNDTTYGLNNPVTQFNVGGGLTTAPSGALLLDINGGTASADEGISQDDGYESGGNVSKALSVTGSTTQTDPFTSATGWIAIGYLGCSDANANNLSPSNGTWLTENGVAESNGSIETGEYSFWGYENFYGRHNIVTGSFQDTDGKKIASGVIATVLSGYSGTAGHDAGVPTTDMNAVKLSDFAFPTHK